MRERERVEKRVQREALVTKGKEMIGKSKDNPLRKKEIPERASEDVVESRKRETQSAKHAGISHFLYQVMGPLGKEGKKYEMILCVA